MHNELSTATDGLIASVKKENSSAVSEKSCSTHAQEV